jgi:hypothetical protein
MQNSVNLIGDDGMHESAKSQKTDSIVDIVALKTNGRRNAFEWNRVALILADC